ncbi:zinc metalloproteinase nas-4-like [Daphnia carinata]|uniref:zinc metalloproteinase nas-4-like n=1 Tax=Daphnia carinata TaxID=120202 RepID=UPI00257F2176|nr:zinc metalloproteinase nas-4-like [Daphnia carinata]
MANQLDPYCLLSFLTIAMICFWTNSIGANPVWAENGNHLEQNEVAFEAGEPLTDEEFNSDAQGKTASVDGAQPWEKQSYNGLLGGDVVPGDKKNANKNADLKWPNAQVPYVISKSFSAEDRRIIASAMAMYHQMTCIRFVARGTQKDYVKIIRSRESTSGQQNNPGCWSLKGRAGNAQELSLDGACVNRATVTHELMHALGFDHEQERPDQKNFIVVKYDNIKKENQQWFTPKPKDAINSIGRYDINSVMHYNAYAFAIDSSKPTMVSKTGKTTMGNRNGLTATDVEKLKKLYCKS